MKRLLGILIVTWSAVAHALEGPPPCTPLTMAAPVEGGAIEAPAVRALELAIDLDGHVAGRAVALRLDGDIAVAPATAALRFVVTNEQGRWTMDLPVDSWRCIRSGTQDELPFFPDHQASVQVTALDATGHESASVVRSVRLGGSSHLTCGAAGALWVIGLPVLVIVGGSLLAAFVSVVRFLRQDRAASRARVARW